MNLTLALSEICRRLVVLGALLVGCPSSTTSHDLVRYPTVAATTASSATAGPSFDVATLRRASNELELARRVLTTLDLADAGAAPYVTTLQHVLDWLDRPGGDLRTDAELLAARLEAARRQLTEQTSSPRQWLALQPPDREIRLPARFVVVTEIAPFEEPNYDRRRLARALLA